MTIAASRMPLSGIRSKSCCLPRSTSAYRPKMPADQELPWGNMDGRLDVGPIRHPNEIRRVSIRYKRVRTHEKYCTRPAFLRGLILFYTRSKTGEPLASIMTRLQHMRGCDGGSGVKYPRRRERRGLGILGSGGMAQARTSPDSCSCGRSRLQASARHENPESFGRESGKYVSR